ncbi:hypothetical protein J2O08_04400 [Elizabethkingia anophelis]|uniref:hypothetical protein n=1 Tax=Elizabethkingia anophelis TaxID=1117645 RepID=UPI0020B3BC79|nr:hypothetical protein [Elizabethkingia anophelis]MCT3662506.1 hypothetical protein [Elizabethkingia anophelis]UTF93939.1 hypothetical protein J2O08_04400 [Elizabethkingia anophelis]
MNRENWIKVDKKAFCEGDFSDIESLLNIFRWKPKNSLKRYNFFIDELPKKIENKENFINLSAINKTQIIEQYKAAYISGKNVNYKYSVLKQENYSEKEFSIEQAIRFFSTPVSLLLENGRNDSYFLKAIFKYFDKEISNKNRLLEFYKNDWIRFENAGGWTNVGNFIEGMKTSLESFCSDEGRDSKDFIRCFVLMDSDKEYPEDIPSSKIELQKKLEAWGIEVHILKKRAMENYMPDEVINNEGERINAISAWVDVYKHLANEQKDYLNYNKGFPKDQGKKRPRNLQHIDIANLYSNPPISDANYDVLDRGMKYPNFKEDFPKNFESPFSFKTALLKREGGTNESNEFNDIINKINKLL